MLVNRLTERAAVDSLLASARGGMGSALVLRGEPGIGKTALLEYAIESASGFRIARAGGVESEMELAFAALHQLCVPALDRLERLPSPQRDALGVAFGLRTGEAPDRFLVGLAVLSLLSEVAGEQPLLCVVDDAQWLDRSSAQALAFVARRLLAERVAMIFAVRKPGGEFTGLREQLVQGLDDTDARALLGSFLRIPLDEQVRERILAEMRGNPLALVELPRGLTPEARVPRTPRSPRSCTSARRPSPTTCGRCSPRSASAPAASSPARSRQNETEPRQPGTELPGFCCQPARAG